MNVNALSAIALVAEEKILAAQKAGVFDKLPGAGKPLRMDDDSQLPPDMRMAYKILKNSGYIEQNASLKEPSSLASQLRQCSQDESRGHGKLKRFTVMLNRVRRAQGKAGGGALAAALENSPYLDKILDRI